MQGKMYYTRLQVICDSEFSEILMAEIAETGFDTFMENEKGFEAYAEQDKYDKQRLHAVKDKYGQFTPVVFYQDKIEKKNWNEEWEKNYEPIIVDDKCMIRAGFHQPEKKISVRNYHHTKNVIWHRSSSNDLPDGEKPDGHGSPE